MKVLIVSTFNFTHVATMYIDASFCENQNLTAPVSCGSKEKKKKNNNFVVPVVASVVGSRSTGFIINCSSCLLGTEKEKETW